MKKAILIILLVLSTGLLTVFVGGRVLGPRFQKLKSQEPVMVVRPEVRRHSTRAPQQRQSTMDKVLSYSKEIISLLTSGASLILLIRKPKRRRRT